MKRLTSFFFALFIAAGFIYANDDYDILTLNNQMQFKGKILKIKDCQVKFKADNSKSYWIPVYDIESVQFANPEEDIYLDYLEKTSPESCLKGNNDADLYHGKAGAHLAYGVLFGPFAMIGAAIASPSPMSGKNTMRMSQNSEMFANPEYLSCYQKKAKSKNVTNAGLGWASWFLLLLIIAGS